MLRTSSRLKLLSLCLTAYAGLAAAQSQQSQQQSQRGQDRPATQSRAQSAQTPPRLDRIEPGSDEPATTIPPKEGTRIIERRGNDGMVREVVVESGPSRYIMKPHNPPGTALPGDVVSGAIRAPQWQILEFDIGNPKKESADPAAPAPAPAKPGAPARAEVPPPPALEPVEKK